MKKRYDDELLLTQELYEKARKGDDIPIEINFYDDESNIYIYKHEGGPCEYYLDTGTFQARLGFVQNKSIREIRNICMPSNEPLPSENDVDVD